MNEADFLGTVNKIIESKSFGRSKTYGNLLKYLVNCTLKNEVPKEVTIATEIFGKRNFDPSQSTLVRVYVYNLRKKLHNYYQREGKEEELKVTIPKGSYKVQLVENNLKTNHSTELPRQKFNAITIAIFIGLLLSISYNFYQALKSQKDSLVNKNGIWKDLSESNLPTMLVLGDLFVYNEYDSILQQERIIRDAFMNSMEELEAFKLNDKRKGVAIEPVTYALLIRNSAIWIKRFTQIFYSLEKDFIIRSMSRYNPKELQEYDIIVTGMIKTMGIFRAYFRNSKIGYRYPSTFLINEDNTTVELGPSGDPNEYHTDYAIIAKFPGPNNNTIYLLGGLWDTGASLSVKYFTDKNAIEKLENALKDKYGYLPTYFEALFEVNGLDRMEIGTEILHLNELDASIDVWDVTGN